MNKKQFDQLREDLKVNNDLLNRIDLAARVRTTHQGDRDMYEVLGYQNNPKTLDYVSRFHRQDISMRIVSAYPEACWRSSPKVTDDLESEDETEFDKIWSELSDRLKIFYYLVKLDKLANLGEYSTLLIGINDGRNLDQEAGKINDPGDITYLRPFSDVNSEIKSYVMDPRDPRFGLPESYQVTMGGLSGGISSMPRRTHVVHHSRILHIAEGTLENDVLGVPRLKPVLNRLVDLEKVVGGSSEIFWINGRGGLHANADKDTNLKNPEKVSEQIDDYIHKLSRVLRTKGMDVKPLEMSVPNPKDHVSVILDLISGATGIPKRILVGSERGELASSQDESNWMNRIQERQSNFCAPMVLEPLIQKFIDLGALSQFSESDIQIVWPDLVSMNEKDKSEINLNRARAISHYIGSAGSDLVVPDKQFVEEILNLEYKEEEIELLKEESEEEIEIEDGDELEPGQGENIGEEA